LSENSGAAASRCGDRPGRDAREPEEPAQDGVCGGASPTLKGRLGQTGYGTLPAEAVGRALGEIGYDGVMMLEVFHQPAVLRRLIDDRCAERLANILDIANARSPDRA